MGQPSGSFPHQASGGRVARGATFNFMTVTFLGMMTWGILLSAAYTTPAAAAKDRARLDDPFEITADRIDYDGERDLYVATGNVRVVQPERSLRARWVAFSTLTRIGVAEGEVELLDGEDRLEAEFMVFDVDTLRGTLFHGSLSAGSEGFYVRAGELIRMGKNSFGARDAVFSTCRCEPGDRLPWQISSKKAEIELGDYGTITNSTFNVLGVPVLWIPWAFFPVKSERETGFLLPEFQLGGRGGYGIGLPFFWAVHPQLNVIATQRFMTERGYKQDVELEYVFGERSEGELFVSGLHDKSHEPSGATTSERWGVLWNHDQELPGKTRWQTDLKAASDNFYSDDFREFRAYKEFRFIESTTNVARGFGASGEVGTMVGARFADDLQGFSYTPTGVPFSGDFVDKDAFTLQRFAEARADIQPGSVVAPFGIEARFDSEVIHFASLRRHRKVFEGQSVMGVMPSLVSDDGRFWDVGLDAAIGNAFANGEGDGLFQPGEAIAERGTRVVVHPRLARVIELGSVAELVPEIGWSQTLYKTDAQRFAERGLLTGRMELRSRLAQDYVNEDGSALRHVIEPRVGWAYVSERHQRGNPIFVPGATVAQSRLRTLSLENVTRNPSDRIGATNQVVLAVDQRFFRRHRQGAAARLQANLLTAVDWDFAEEGLGNLSLEARFFQMGPINGRLFGAFDPEVGAVDEGFVELNFVEHLSRSWVRQIRLSARYRYRRRVPQFLETDRGNGRFGEDSSVNQINLSASLQLTTYFRLRYSTVFKIAGEDEFIKNEGIVEYVSKCRCWGVGVTVSNRSRQGIGGGILIRVLGLGDEGSGLFSGGFGTGLDF